MEAPKVRLSKVLADTSGKLDRLLLKDRENVRSAFDSLVEKFTDGEGAVDGLKVEEKLKTVLEACPEEGPTRDAFGQLMDRIGEERRYRGDLWCRASLVTTLREHIRIFGDEPPAAEGEGAAPKKASKKQ